MKKKQQFPDYERSGFKKVLIVMKLTTIFLFLSALAMATSTFSQNARFDLSVKDASIIQVFDEIERVSDYGFLFKTDQLDLNRKYTLDLKNANIEKVLQAVLDQNEFTYNFIDRNIVISRIESQTSQDNKVNKVSGKVTDSSGSPLPGVSVVVKGTTTGAITDGDGNYSLTNVPGNATLLFSFVGMKTQEVSVGTKTTINVVLVEETIGIDEVVAIGYGNQKKSSVTGAITTMEAEEVKNIPVTKLSNVLAGRMSGVYVNQASGAPGYGADIRIRSVNTWKGAVEPLYVIDGIISTKQVFDALTANEIKSITVLKDAASSAVYGARGGNGVILITTNTGNEGKFKLTYNYSYSFDRPTEFPKYVDAKDMVRLINYAFTSTGQQPRFGEQEVAYFSENDPARALFDEVYRDPVLQNHSVSVTGGGEKIKYFVSGSTSNQSAFLTNADYKTYNLRSNINANFTKNLNGFFNMSYHYSQKNRFVMQEDNVANFEVDDTFGQFWARILYWQPYAAPKTSDGKLINPGWIGNALGFVEEGGMNTRDEYNLNTVMGLTYKAPFLKGLSFSGIYSPQFFYRHIKHYETKMTLYNVEKEGEHGFIYTDNVISSTQSSYPSKERLAKSSRLNKDYQLNLSANYQKNFDKHSIGAMFNMEVSEGYRDYFYGVRENFPLLQKPQFWATGSSREDSYVDGSEYEYGRMSYIGRFMYDYDEKYFLNATLRRDGSMLFAPDYRWGNFPSVSLGWVISKEDFLSDSFINFLKIRTTWGLTGNDDVGGWAWAESFSSNGSYMMGSSIVPRVKFDGIINEKLTWEQTSEYNIGFDSRLFNGVILNFEYYNRHNFDILGSRIASLPSSYGGKMPPVNYGVVDGHGFEFELGYNGRLGELFYEIKGNLSYATNKVVVKDVPENVRDVNNPIGKSTDYVATLVSTGIMRTPEEVAALPQGYTIFGLKPTIGALNFEDVSGIDGVPDGKIDGYDEQVIVGKHYLPPYTYGFNINGTWKGIGIDIFFQGVLGVSKMYNDDYGGLNRSFYQNQRQPVMWLDSWSEDNIDASWPKPVPAGKSKDQLASTFWLKNGDYLRLKNINISYSIPKSIIGKLNISDATLMVSATNLLTLTGFKYYDPTINSYGAYPNMKSYTFGINVTF